MPALLVVNWITLLRGIGARVEHEVPEETAESSDREELHALEVEDELHQLEFVILVDHYENEEVEKRLKLLPPAYSTP